VNRKDRERAEVKPPQKTTRINGKTRPTLDEWGLYDPAKCGFGALYAKLEELEEGEGSDGDQDAAEPVDGTVDPAIPSTARNPRPLSMWASRAAAEPERAAARKANGLPPDDFRGLVARLNIPPAIAAVSYASGVRIRRVRVSPRARVRKTSQVIILSRKLLNAVREHPTPDA